MKAPSEVKGEIMATSISRRYSRGVSEAYRLAKQVLHCIQLHVFIKNDRHMNKFKARGKEPIQAYTKHRNGML